MNGTRPPLHISVCDAVKRPFAGHEQTVPVAGDALDDLWIIAVFELMREHRVFKRLFVYGLFQGDQGPSCALDLSVEVHQAECRVAD